MPWGGFQRVPIIREISRKSSNISKRPVKNPLEFPTAPHDRQRFFHEPKDNRVIFKESPSCSFRSWYWCAVR